MLVLIDESGDAGFKIVRGSTPYFVVAMVVFRDFKEAERASLAIAEARERLRVKPEFKFNKCHPNARDGFFQAVHPFDFQVRALVVQKARIYSDNLRENKERFYNYFVQLLLKHDNDVLQGARVKIDGSGDREFKRELERYLRQQCQAGKITSVKFAEYHRDNLIQLADMAAGAIARSYRDNDRKDAGRQDRRRVGFQMRGGSPPRPRLESSSQAHPTVTIRNAATRCAECSGMNGRRQGPFTTMVVKGGVLCCI